MATNGSTVRYTYDGFGRRIEREGAGGTKAYIWDGDDVFLELDGSGVLVAEYTHRPGLGRPHALRRTGSTYYYGVDELGSTVGLINSSGSVVNEYRYDAWGAMRGVSETVPNAMRYTGLEWEGDAGSSGPGLYYARARFYDPELGRFISEDPLGLAAGINPFTYAANDPVNLTDRAGLSPCDLFIVGSVRGIPILGIVCSSAELFAQVEGDGGASSGAAAQDATCFSGACTAGRGFPLQQPSGGSTFTQGGVRPPDVLPSQSTGTCGRAVRKLLGSLAWDIAGYLTLSAALRLKVALRPFKANGAPIDPRGLAGRVNMVQAGFHNLQGRWVVTQADKAQRVTGAVAFGGVGTPVVGAVGAGGVDLRVNWSGAARWAARAGDAVGLVVPGVSSVVSGFEVRSNCFWKWLGEWYAHGILGGRSLGGALGCRHWCGLSVNRGLYHHIQRDPWI